MRRFVGFEKGINLGGWLSQTELTREHMDTFIAGRACDILLRHLPKERLCGVAQYIGRDGENKRLMSLGELRSAAVDMFCTVFIGNEMTREIAQNMVTPRGYRDV